MAKRKAKSDSNADSKKANSKQTVSQQSAEDKHASEKQGSLARFFGFFIPGVGFGGAFLLISALVIGALYWCNTTYFYSDNSQSWQVEYNLPQGVWAGVDIKEFVLKSNPDLFEKPYDDKTLLEDVANSFNLSPIVKMVKSAKRRFPNTVVLEIEYFEPVAMVNVNYEKGGHGLVPVDKDGFRLPTIYFKKSDLESYIAITGIASLPTNPVGSCWNDTQVEIACKIANDLAPYKNEFGIVGIHVHKSSVVDDRYNYPPMCFDIWLKNNTIIRWAAYLFKSTEVQPIDDELSTQEKIAILRQRLQEKGEIKPDSPKEMFRFVPQKEAPQPNNADEKQ